MKRHKGSNVEQELLIINKDSNLPPRVRIPEDNASDIEGERSLIKYEMAAADPRNSKKQ